VALACLGIVLLSGCRRPDISGTFARVEMTIYSQATVTFTNILDFRKDGTFVWTSDHVWKGEHSGLDVPHMEVRGTFGYNSGQIACFNENGEVWCRLKRNVDNLLVSESDSFKLYYRCNNLETIPVQSNLPSPTSTSRSASGWMTLASGTGYTWRSASENDKREMCARFASVSRHGVSAQTFYDALDTAYNTTDPNILQASIKFTAQYAEDFSEGFRK